MQPDPYGWNFITTDVDRVHRIPARQLFSLLDPESPLVHTTPLDTHIMHARLVHSPLSALTLLPPPVDMDP